MLISILVMVKTVNRYCFDLTYFHIKKEKWLFLICLMVIYLLGLPMCINALKSSLLEGTSSIIVCFNEMQRVLLPIVLIILSVLLRSYVDTQYRKVIFTLDQRRKWHYIFIYMIYIGIILIPFYLILYIISNDIGIYLLIVSFQIFVLIAIYYGLSMMTKSTLMSVGVLLGYLLFFSFMYTYQGMGNLLLLNMTVDRISISYYLSSFIVVLLAILVGRFFEKRF